MTSREWRALPASIRDTIAEHQREIPLKLARLGRALGVDIKAATLDAGISGEIRPDGQRFVIKVNRHDGPRRQRFTVAHEIAHFLLHRDQIGSGISDDVLYRSALSDSREAEANRLAADILMPLSLIEPDKARLGDHAPEELIQQLADKYDVSEPAMRIRLGIPLGEPQI